MGVGPNYGLDKGFLLQGSTAVVQGELLTLGTVEQSVVRATTANSRVIFVAQEDVDATRVATGKVFINGRVYGISRVLAGAGVTVGASLTNNTSARAVAMTRAVAGAQPAHGFGICLSIVGSNTTTVDGDYIDALIIPGLTY